MHEQRRSTSANGNGETTTSIRQNEDKTHHYTGTGLLRPPRTNQDRLRNRGFKIRLLRNNIRTVPGQKVETSGWSIQSNVRSGMQLRYISYKGQLAIFQAGGMRKMSERRPRWSWTLLVHQGGLWSPWSTRSTPIHSDPHFFKFYGKCGPGWIMVDQEDQGDHNPPWWTRTGFYILLMAILQMQMLYEGKPKACVSPHRPQELSNLHDNE